VSQTPAAAPDAATVSDPSEPVLAPAEIHAVGPQEPARGRVVSSSLCMKGKSASFVRHVAIDVGDTPLAGRFRAGQSFGVVPPGVDERGRPNKLRLYSIASPSFGEDGEGRVLATTPKRLLAERTPQRDGDDPEDHRLFVGACSNYLCDLRPGDEVMVTGPSGKRFLLPEDPSKHDFLFLATGTGIAPFRGMALELLRHSRGACGSRVELVMGSPYTTDLLYDDLMCELASEHPNFTYHPVISRERRDDGGRGEYVHQFLERRLDRFGEMLANPRTLIYICGLAGMQSGVFSLLGRHGFANGYLRVAEELAGVDPKDWTAEQIHRRVRHAPRCMVEVY
jgi:ferredoxin--NADP+ reductase